eukprot:scaffold1405_cov92-Cylindrotheca_fusiformis.AAC.1
MTRLGVEEVNVASPVKLFHGFLSMCKKKEGPRSSDIAAAPSVSARIPFWEAATMPIHEDSTFRAHIRRAAMFGMDIRGQETRRRRKEIWSQ